MSRSGARVVSARVRGRGYKLSSRRESRLYNCCCAPYALLDRGTLRRRRAPVAMLGVAYCAAGRRGGRLFSVVFGWRRARCCCCRLLLAGRQLIRPVLPTAPITDCQHWNLVSSAHVFRGGCACLGIDCSVSTAPRAEKYLNEPLYLRSTCRCRRRHRSLQEQREQQHDRHQVLPGPPPAWSRASAHHL